MNVYVSIFKALLNKIVNMGGNKKQWAKKLSLMIDSPGWTMEGSVIEARCHILSSMVECK